MEYSFFIPSQVLFSFYHIDVHKNHQFIEVAFTFIVTTFISIIFIFFIVIIFVFKAVTFV